MNTATSLPGFVASASTAALIDTRLESVSAEADSSDLEGTSASLISELMTVITESLGNDTHSFNSSYSPGNMTSPVNATRIPTEDEDMGIKRLIVILTNVFVVVAIIVTCFLAFQHRRWENKMRLERQKDPICNYDLVDIEEEEITEDYETFEK